MRLGGLGRIVAAPADRLPGGARELELAAVHAVRRHGTRVAARLALGDLTQHARKLDRAGAHGLVGAVCGRMPDVRAGEAGEAELGARQRTDDAVRDETVAALEASHGGAAIALAQGLLRRSGNRAAAAGRHDVVGACDRGTLRRAQDEQGGNREQRREHAGAHRAHRQHGDVSLEQRSGSSFRCLRGELTGSRWKVRYAAVTRGDSPRGPDAGPAPLVPPFPAAWTTETRLWTIEVR